MKHSLLFACMLLGCVDEAETSTTTDELVGPCRWDSDCGLYGACVNAACAERCGVRPPCTDSAGRSLADCRYYSCSYDTNTSSLCIAGDTLGTYIVHHHQEGWASGFCLNWAPNGQICPRGAYDRASISCSGE